MLRAAFPSGRNSLVLSLAIVGAIIGIAWWSQRPPREPVHDGQRLSEWLEARGELFEVTPQVIEQLHAFGPGVVPWLAHTAEYGGYPRPKVKPRPGPFDHTPAWVRRCVSERWGGLIVSSPADERVNAVRALRALGPEAEPAIPALIKMLDAESSDPMHEIDHLASLALHAIGPPSWPAIEQTIERGSSHAKSTLVSTISSRLYKHKPASEDEFTKIATVLLKATHDPDVLVRANATSGLCYCYRTLPNAASFEPAISEAICMLSDSEAAVRSSAAHGLSECGAKATPAIPRLILAESF